MKEIWETKFSKDKDKHQNKTSVTTNMLNLEVGKAPDVENIKKLIAKKRIDLENS